MVMRCEFESCTIVLRAMEVSIYLKDDKAHSNKFSSTVGDGGKTMSTTHGEGQCRREYFSQQQKEEE